jgi:CBS domain-containing protein
MNAESVMTVQPAYCRPHTSLMEVARLMANNDCGEIPVVDEESRPIGVVTDRDITCRAVAAGRNPLALTANDCMTSPCFVITSDTDLSECCLLLQAHQLRRLIVVDDDGHLCGIVAQADIARHASAHDTGQVVKKVSQSSVYVS